MADGIFVHPFIQVYDNNMYINFGGVSSWASPSDYDKTNGMNMVVLHAHHLQATTPYVPKI